MNFSHSFDASKVVLGRTGSPQEEIRSGFHLALRSSTWGAEWKAQEISSERTISDAARSGY